MTSVDYYQATLLEYNTGAFAFCRYIKYSKKFTLPKIGPKM